MARMLSKGDKVEDVRNLHLALTSDRLALEPFRGV
jgi:hypothetical protein